MYVNKYIKNHQRYLKLKFEKLRNKYKSRYLISKYMTFTRLNLYIKIIFLFKQIIIEIEKQIKLIK